MRGQKVPNHEILGGSEHEKRFVFPQSPNLALYGDKKSGQEVQAKKVVGLSYQPSS